MTTRGQRARTPVALAVMMLMVWLMAFVAAAEEPASFPGLAPAGEPLRAAFNRDAGRVRLLFFIDPT